MDPVYYAGIDIGGTKISVLVTDETGNVLGRAKRKSRPERGFRSVMERAVECLDEACDGAGIARASLATVGVGAPSPILPDGTAVAAPNMGWENVPVGRTLTQALAVPVFVENDCNAGTFGEYTHGDKKGQTLVGLFMGTGLGGGIVRNGQLVSGDNSMAGEVGHMTVVVGGRPCGCGKRGCIEAYASKRGMGYALKEALVLEKRSSRLMTSIEAEEGLDNVRSSVLRRHFEEGDEVVRAVVSEAARFLGVATGNLITLLGPATIVLGGGVMDALGRELLPLVKRSAAEHTFPRRSFADTSIELARLGDDAVALGALAYAQSRWRTDASRLRSEPPRA